MTIYPDPDPDPDSEVGIVYRITDKRNGRMYLGKHCGTFDDGYITSSVILTKYIKKHGKEKFYENFDRALLYKGVHYAEAETLLISALDLCNDPMWYNLAHTHNRSVMSDETKGRISVANRGRVFSEKSLRRYSEINTGNRNPMYGRKHSAETRAKMSASQKDRAQISDETRAKMSSAAKSRPKKQCPHCGNKFDPLIFARYHGDRCKKS